uniref:Uncharacterized protein n=1 Tax=Chlorobium chlorochromatii (strain CaD3) TaxID=340177 RepID=Q3AR27_CHLCH
MLQTISGCGIASNATSLYMSVKNTALLFELIAPLEHYGSMNVPYETHSIPIAIKSNAQIVEVFLKNTIPLIEKQQEARRSSAKILRN